MRRRSPTATIRRIASLPSAPTGESSSVSRRRLPEFEGAVAAMAADPQVQAECAAIAKDFAATEADGLGDD